VIDELKAEGKKYVVHNDSSAGYKYIAWND
jgi:hypothetical protein